MVYKCKNKLDKYDIFKEQALHPELILSTSKKYTCAYLLFSNNVSFPLDCLLDSNRDPILFIHNSQYNAWHIVNGIFKPLTNGWDT